MKQKLFYLMCTLLGGVFAFMMFIAVCIILSPSDEPVMNLPAVEDLAGEWECQGGLRGAKVAIGNGMKPGNLILRSNRICIAQNFPEPHPLRLIEKSGPWDLLDPTRTPSGVCSVELDGTFLSLHHRGDKLVLHYPVDVLEGISVEYVKTNPRSNQ